MIKNSGQEFRPFATSLAAAVLLSASLPCQMDVGSPPPSLSASLPCQMDVGRFTNGPQHEKYKKILQEMITEAMDILSNPLCVRTLSKIPDLSRKEFKTESNQGFVWFASCKEHVDLGNWMYAFLFEFLVHNAADDHPILALGKRYSSLQAHHEFSLGSMELRADVIECMLAGCRETSSSVPENLKDDRIQLNKQVKKFLAKADTLTRWLVDFNKDATWLNPKIVYKAGMDSLGIAD